MAENKAAAQNCAGVQPGPGTTEAANAPAVANHPSADQLVQREYEAIVADIAREGDFHFEKAQAESDAGREGALGFAGTLGKTLTDPALIARFEGVRENLMREVRGGMCTADQAHAYLENIEISLLLEQEATVSA